MSVRAPRLAAAPSDTVAARRPAPRGWPLLRLAFRPFHPGAALFGMLVLPLWGVSLAGRGVGGAGAAAAALGHARDAVRFCRG